MKTFLFSFFFLLFFFAVYRGGVQSTLILRRWGHTVVITRNGRVFGFGLNREGQLGLSISDQSVVVEPRELTVSSVLSEQHFGEKLHPIQVSCGLDHTLIVCDDGRVFAAGLNEQVC